MKPHWFTRCVLKAKINNRPITFGICFHADVMDLCRPNTTQGVSLLVLDLFSCDDDDDDI